MAKDILGSSTHWTLISRAQGEGPQAQAALGELIRRYEQGIVLLIRRYRHPPDQTAEEIKQQFLLRVLERNDVAHLAEEKGHFRGWLTIAVRRHLSNLWDAWFAKKNPARHTDCPPGLDATFAEDTEERFVCQKLARDTLVHVRSVMQAKARDERRFRAFQRFLPGPDLMLGDLSSVCKELSMTATGARKAICELRRDYAEAFDDAIADTLNIDRNQPEGKAELAREKALLYRYSCEPPTLRVQILAE
jgi:hypothetical protein